MILPFLNFKSKSKSLRMLARPLIKSESNLLRQPSAWGLSVPIFKGRKRLLKNKKERRRRNMYWVQCPPPRCIFFWLLSLLQLYLILGNSWMKKLTPGSQESPVSSPMPQKRDSLFARSTPKVNQMTTDDESSDLMAPLSQANLNDDEFLVESDTLQVTPRNLTKTWMASSATSLVVPKSALKKPSHLNPARSVRIQEPMEM